MRVALRLTLANHDLSVTSASAGAQAAIPGPDFPGPPLSTNRIGKRRTAHAPT
jgi:hypothetical protein